MSRRRKRVRGLRGYGCSSRIASSCSVVVAEGVGALVVTEGDHVHGIVSERDVVMAIAAGTDLDSTTAGDLDSRRLVTCTPDTTVQAAGVLMMENYVRHLLVTDQTGPVGMVSARDLLGAYVA
jgi:CBS domain-containing protein